MSIGDLLRSLQIPNYAQDSLEVMNGPEDGRVFPVEHTAMTVGRVESSDVVLRLDGSVSRAHARISFENGNYFVEDLGSTHGTYVCGDKIQTKVQLKHGDYLMLGSTVLRLTLKNA